MTIDQNCAVHMIGNAHLDPVWLWRWQEGFAEIKATFRSALDRMNEYPEFIFTCAGAAYYKWIEDNCPEMFQEIKERVKEGRWVMVGGWWIQPDCNIPCGESFVRHGLYSQRYFLEKFGIKARTGYNVDSFGHNGMLPQILKKSGMDRYVFMRPGQHEKDLSEDLFYWESKDGSRVLTSRISHYSVNVWKDKKRLENDIRVQLEATAAGAANGRCHDLMNFYGVGNHGGGPTIANIECIRKLQAETGNERLLFSSPDRYFNEIEKQETDLPVVRDDLQHHASGCYSTHSQIKALNRRAEHRLINAEKFSTLAHLLLGLVYPSAKLQDAWEKVLFNQFHDIMGGCSIKEACDDACEFYGWSLAAGAEMMNAAVQKISWAIDTQGSGPVNPGKTQDWMLWETDDQGVPLVVFNPLSWDVAAPVQVNTLISGITDDQGAPLEIQQVRGPYTNGNQKWNTLFIGHIPAMGYRVFRMYGRKTLKPENSGAPLTAGRSFLENDRVLLEIDEHTGYITRLFDKRHCAEVFSAEGAVPVVIDETHCDTWAHGIFTFDREISRFGNAEAGVLESGPLRSTIRVTSHYNNSVLQQDFSIDRDCPDVEVRVKLDWREQHKMLKLAFPVNVDTPAATYEIPYGFIERPTSGEEEPGQQWLDVSGKAAGAGTGSSRGGFEGIYGLALLNDSKYSFSVQGSEMQMTVVRSPAYADHFGERDERLEFMDQGIQTFCYRLVPHAGTWQAGKIARKAYELNVPLVYVAETTHKGCLPLKLEGIRTGAENIIASVFKVSEDRQGYVLRCYEAYGQKTSANLELPLLGRYWPADFGVCEIKTFYIPFKTEMPVYEINLIENEDE